MLPPKFLNFSNGHPTCEFLQSLPLFLNISVFFLPGKISQLPDKGFAAVRAMCSMLRKIHMMTILKREGKVSSQQP